MSPQEKLIYNLKKRQTSALVDRYGLHIANIAAQSRDMALIAFALLQDDEKRRDLIVEISEQVSDVTNLMLKLRSKHDA